LNQHAEYFGPIRSVGGNRPTTTHVAFKCFVQKSFQIAVHFFFDLYADAVATQG
jgi:hypothetical protein